MDIWHFFFLLLKKKEMSKLENPVLAKFSIDNEFKQVRARPDGPKFL